MRIFVFILSLCTSCFAQNKLVDPCFLNGPDQSQAVSPWVADQGWFARDKYSNPACESAHRAVDWKCLRNGICKSGAAAIGKIYQIVEGQGAGKYAFRCNYVHMTVSATWTVWGVKPDGSWTLLWTPLTAYHLGSGNRDLLNWRDSGFRTADLPDYPQYAVQLVADLLVPPDEWDTGLKTNGWWFGKYDGQAMPTDHSGQNQEEPTEANLSTDKSEPE